MRERDSMGMEFIPRFQRIGFEGRSSWKPFFPDKTKGFPAAVPCANSIGPLFGDHFVSSGV